MCRVQLVVEAHLIADRSIYHQRAWARGRQKIHSPSCGRNTSRQVHFAKRVINRFASNEEQAVQDNVGFRVRVDIGDVDKLPSAENVKFLESVDTAKYIYFRAL